MPSDLPRFSALPGAMPVAEHGARHPAPAPMRPHALPVMDIEMRDGAAHVRLDEDALGPIEVRVERSEIGLSLVMRAERSDSADLLRRNADLLQRELAENGVAHTRIDFGQGGGRSEGDRALPRRKDGGGRPGSEPAATAVAQPVRRGVTGVQLDMRL